MEQNFFIRHMNDYPRNYDILEHKIADSAYYLHKRYGKPIEECREFVIAQFKAKGIRPPKIKYLHRQENGDRVKKETTLFKYLANVQRTNLLMSPTMATYVREEDNRSLLAEMTEGNVDLRNATKKEQHAAKQQGDVALEKLKEVQQTTFKIKNNSLSGAHGSPHSPLFNKSAHSTLTSTCRSMTTTNNAHSERFIAGNRHYYHPSIVMNNITAIAKDTRIDEVRDCLDHYGLKTPTVDQVFEGILRSTNMYFRSPEAEVKIREYLETLCPEQLAMFFFGGDLYGNAIVNEEFTMTMLDELSDISTPSETVDYSKVDINRMGEEETVFVSTIHIDRIKGKSLKKIPSEEPEFATDIAATYINMVNKLGKYRKFITVFLACDHPPASIGNFTSSLRRVVPVSDTDSTVYTVQDWVAKRFGDVVFHREARGFAAAVGYLNNKLSGHWLAMLSGHMGIAEDRKEQLVMKNEFSFPVIFMTGKAKHYAMLIDGCEGMFYAKEKLELKGVSFRSSKVPKVLRDYTVSLIVQVMNDVRDGKRINNAAILKDVADLERKIMTSLTSGEVKYLPTAQVKEMRSYNKPLGAAFKHLPMFNAMFAKEYGPAPTPPYQAVKVDLELKSARTLVEWQAKIKDSPVPERLRAFCEDPIAHHPEVWDVLDAEDRERFAEKKSIGIPTSLLVPYDVAKGGVPKELLAIIDKRKLVTSLLESVYLALESLGIYYNTKKNTVIISDNY